MSQSLGMPRPPRDRSRLVCYRCHARKVKCDLAARFHTHDNCTNCEKRLEDCQRRSGVKSRSRAHGLERPPVTLPGPSSTLAIQQFLTVMESPGASTDSEHNQYQLNRPEVSGIDSFGNSYVGEASIMSSETLSRGTLDTAEALGNENSYAKMAERQTIAVTGADQLPSRSNIEASAAAYFEFLYHGVPIVDEDDITSSQPSTLLLQAVCFAGSYLRHPKPSVGLQETERLYTKTKLLIVANHEASPIPILKALCLLSLWNAKHPSVVVAIDAGWNWLGLAIRLAIQMGLHRESTHSRVDTPTCCRRIAWFLYSSDQIASACFGRPQMLHADDFDLRPLTEVDFDQSRRREGRLFVLFTQLAGIYSKVVAPWQNRKRGTVDDVLSVLCDLRKWALNLPSDLRMIAEQSTRVYDRDLYQLFTCYLTCIITFFHSCRRYFQPAVASQVSLVASSCAIALYQDMDNRDDINYLTAISNWFMVAASVPQLNNLAREYRCVDLAGTPSEHASASLGELESIIQILKQRTIKFPGARTFVAKIERFKNEIITNQCSSRFPLSGLENCGGSGTASNPGLSDYVPVSNVRELFPFPQDLTSRLAILGGLDLGEIADEVFDKYPEWALGNSSLFDDMGINMGVDMGMEFQL